MPINVAVLARTPHQVPGAFFYDVRVTTQGAAYVFRVIANEHGVFAPANGWPALPPHATSSEVKTAVQEAVSRRFSREAAGRMAPKPRPEQASTTPVDEDPLIRMR